MGELEDDGMPGFVSRWWVAGTVVNGAKQVVDSGKLVASLWWSISNLPAHGLAIISVPASLFILSFSVSLSFSSLLILHICSLPLILTSSSLPPLHHSHTSSHSPSPLLLPIYFHIFLLLLLHLLFKLLSLFTLGKKDVYKM